MRNEVMMHQPIPFHKPNKKKWGINRWWTNSFSKPNMLRRIVLYSTDFGGHFLTMMSGAMPLMTFSVDRFTSGVLVAIDLFQHSWPRKVRKEFISIDVFKAATITKYWMNKRRMKIKYIQCGFQHIRQYQMLPKKIVQIVLFSFFNIYNQ